MPFYTKTACLSSIQYRRCESSYRQTCRFTPKNSPLLHYFKSKSGQALHSICRISTVLHNFCKLYIYCKYVQKWPFLVLQYFCNPKKLGGHDVLGRVIRVCPTSGGGWNAALWGAPRGPKMVWLHFYVLFSWRSCCASGIKYFIVYLLFVITLHKHPLPYVPQSTFMYRFCKSFQVIFGYQ